MISLLSALVNALKMLTGTDGPVDGAGGDAKLLLDLVQKIEGIVGVAVQFIDKGKNRDMAHDTDFEQFSGLGLDTLGCVDNHDRRVCSHQGTVGILREVLMSRCIQNVDAVAVVVELQYGRGDGNASLLLDLHPVGNRMPGCGFCLLRNRPD